MAFFLNYLTTLSLIPTLACSDHAARSSVSAYMRFDNYVLCENESVAVH